MIPAYDELYLNDAMNELGEMLDYAVNDCHIDGDTFFSMFISSGIAAQFERGNPKYVGGMSGVELALEILSKTFSNLPFTEPSYPDDKSAEFWTGWAMAYYQWKTSLCFKEMLYGGLTVSKIRSMYILHEADISKFEETATGILKGNLSKRETHLKTVRRMRGLTQKSLAEKSGITLRMIQLYEQRQNNINRAEAATVLALSRALHCRMEELLEPEI